MDLRRAVIASLDELVASEFVEKTIEETLQKTIASVIHDALSSYGAFGKQLKAAVEKSLAIGEDLDLPSYNHAILEIVRRQVEHATNGAIEKQVAERMKDLLQPAPASISLSALVEKYREQLKDEASCVCYGDDHRITLKVVEEDSLFKRIYLSEKPDAKDRDWDIQISTHHGKVYWLAFKNRALEDQLFCGPLHGFERMLFQMKAAGSMVVFDQDPADIETSYAPEYA